MKHKTIHIILASFLAVPVALSAEVTVYASDIPSPSASWTTLDGLMTLTDSAGNFRSGGSFTGSYGGSGSNLAYDNGDAATMTLTFSANSGLSQIGSMWTRASAVITGFVADPGLTVTGGSGATATYNAGAGSVTISQPWNGGTVVLYNFANPGASAGRTLTFTYAKDIGGAAGYQFAVNRIVYQDAPSAPVISTGLPVSTTISQGANTTFSVTLAPGVLPVPSYLWELDAPPIEGIYVQVGTGTTYTVTGATPAKAGNYRVTVTNSAGSDVSTGALIVDGDADNDGLPNGYETNTGVYVSPSNTGTNPNVSDSDNDGLLDGAEVLTHLTNPNIADTDGDGLNDGAEVNIHHTNPLVVDSDGDGLNDGAEVLTHLTNPNLTDTDSDGYQDGYEVTTLGSNPTLASSPGGPNPTAVAIAFANLYGEQTGYPFTPTTYAGVAAVRQKNWNRTVALPYGFLTATTAQIGQPTAGVLVDSAGSSTTTTVSVTAGGVWSDLNEQLTPYGHLFNAFAYNDAGNPSVSVSLGSIPYSTYDVYVYVGADFNGRTGVVTSGATSYSFTSGSNTTGGLSDYVETTAATGDPVANYCVFRNQTGSSFAFNVTRGNNNVGVFGIQIVNTASSSAYGGWATAKGLNPLTDGAPAFDKDNDGSSNLMEYAFFTNPTDGKSRPAQTLATGGTDVTLTYLRAKAATDVTYTAEWSANLVNWSSAGLTQAPTGTENLDTIEYRASVAKGADPKKFLRVRATLATAP